MVKYFFIFDASNSIREKTMKNNSTTKMYVKLRKVVNDNFNLCAGASILKDVA